MKVLFVHNDYRNPGGETQSFLQEVQLLRSRGHTIVEYTRTNDDAAALNPAGKIALPLNMIWSRQTYREITALIAREHPDIAHINSTHFVISPSVYHACHNAGIPTVLSLHNFRLVCPNALLLRNGKICEACLGKTFAWPGILYGCWRESRPLTGVIATTTFIHHLLQTWNTRITRYIALSDFSRKKFVEGGLPSDKIVIRPLFLDPDPGVRSQPGNYALFVGRLSAEKGLDILLDALQITENMFPDIPLKIVGDGPLKKTLRTRAELSGRSNLSFEGWQPAEQTLNLMKGAYALVMPSISYETFGRVIIEAFACGVPVIASDLGSMAELVTNKETGLLFPPGDAQALAVAIEWAWRHPDEMWKMGQNARSVYEQKYTAEVSYASIIRIYEDAIRSFQS